MRATWTSTFRLARLLLGDLLCWARHEHDCVGGGRSSLALCPCGREWRGQVLLTRDWRASARAFEADLSAGEIL